MAYPYQNNLANNYYPSQPMFPQPQGNVYIIQNSLEVANIPAGAGITAALCSAENLLYIKSIQNGMPVFQAYKLTPYNETPKTTEQTTEKENFEQRIEKIEKQLSTLISTLGGKSNERTIPPKSTTTEQWDI